MPQTITITTDTKSFERGLAEYTKQIPFACSLALNRFAKMDAVPALRQHVSDNLIIRKPDFIQQGIRFRPSTHKNLQVIIGDIDPLIGLMGSGGGERPPEMSKTHAPAVPGTGEGMPRPTLKSVVDRPSWPKSWMRKTDKATGSKTRFLLPTRTGQIGVFERVGTPTRLSIHDRKMRKGRGSMRIFTRPRYPIQLQYVLAHRPIIVKKNWPWQKIVDDAFAARWPERVADAILYAIKIARGKS